MTCVCSGFVLLLVGNAQQRCAKMWSGRGRTGAQVSDAALALAGVQLVPLGGRVPVQIAADSWHHTGAKRGRGAPSQAVLHVLPIHLHQLRLQKAVQHGVCEPLFLPQASHAFYDQVALVCLAVVLHRLHRGLQGAKIPRVQQRAVGLWSRVEGTHGASCQLEVWVSFVEAWAIQGAVELHAPEILHTAAGDW